MGGKVLGAALVASPFVAVAVGLWLVAGPVAMLLAFGLAAIFIIAVVSGLQLMG